MIGFVVRYGQRLNGGLSASGGEPTMGALAWSRQFYSIGANAIDIEKLQVARGGARTLRHRTARMKIAPLFDRRVIVPQLSAAGGCAGEPWAVLEDHSGIAKPPAPLPWFTCS